jgi:uncharacterized protein (TIGR01777 family)
VWIKTNFMDFLARPARVLVCGATGLLGTALVAHLRCLGHTVCALSRRPGPSTFTWDPDQRSIDPAVWQTHWDLIINLAGTPIAALWTRGRKRAILKSRILGTRFLVQQALQSSSLPSVWVNASGIALSPFLDTPEAPVAVDTHTYGQFLPEVVKQWELQTTALAGAGVRVVQARTAVVLASQGGFWPRVLPWFRRGLGLVPGSGQQWFSWIHVHDWVRALVWAIQHEAAQSPWLLGSPHPLTVADWTQQLSLCLGRGQPRSMPAWVLRLLGGEAAQALLLQSHKVYPHKLLQSGFSFRYPTFKSTLAQLLKAP